MPAFFRYSLLLLIFEIFLVQTSFVFAQGIRGKVSGANGDPLPFASIYIRNLGDGVPTNQNGQYEFKLKPGYYDVVAQYLGYASQVKTVEVKDGWAVLDFDLEEQVYALQEVTVKTKQEDPALTIMRKAISKAKFHRLQVQEYSMMVYLKGTGQLTNAPFFMKKELEKEGMKLNEAYTTESVSQITFKQPNSIEEKVISIRTSGENNQTSPAPYIATSFYNDKVNQAVTPLSPAAFAYYKFTYEGSFIDNGVMVNRVKVTPRSRGEQVFEGYIYIIEDLWAIHSLDLKTSFLGFQIGVKQIYQPVAENVWMPSTHTYTFGGKFFGFAGEYQYLASTRDYKIKLNPELIVDTKIIDEKVDEVPADVSTFSKSLSSLEQLSQAEKMTRKDFRKMINEYEKEAAKENKDADIISERNYSIDSMAKKRDLSYWDSIRPIKLTDAEVRGYMRDDSLAVIEAAKESKVDSVARKARRKFQPMEILTGGTYNFGKGRSMGFHTNMTRFSFNTVEGFKFGLSGFYRIEGSRKLADSTTVRTHSWNFRPEFRYGFASRQPYGTLDIRHSVNKGRPGYTAGITGGKFIYQFNADNPISEQVNMLYSLLLRQNFMKLYEQDFVRGYFNHRLNDGLTYRTSLLYAQRSELVNNSDFSFYRRPERTYTSNRPENIEATPAAFADHQALIWNTSLEWRPGLKYSIRNGKKSPLYSTAPLLNFTYKKAFGGIEEMTAADFDLLEVNLEHFFNFGVSGKLDFNLTAGTFLNNNRVYFQDFRHFGGNRTIFANMGVASNYRFLDYYQYSSQTNYVSSIMHYRFRKFLLTQLPMLRFSGVRENIFLNYLKTDNSPHYWEVGYSLDNLFRIFRVEFGAGFENTNFQRAGVRLGIASFINISIND